MTKSIRAWHEIKASKYIVHLLTHAIDLDFISLPAPNKPVTYELSIEVEQEAWLKQVKRFRDLKCVCKLSPQEAESAVFAPMFVRPKKDSPEYRCIYDMRYVNRHIRYKHFKNEGLHTVRELVRCNVWMSKVDVKDAYFHCPVRWEHHKFMAYVDENGEFWCFVALPFGLTPAPRWFTKIMREVITYFRSLGIRLMVYMDDIVIFTEVVGGEFDTAKEKATFTHNFVVQKLKELGWCINEAKNISEPTHKLEILELMVDSHTMTISAPSYKIKKLKKTVRAFLETGYATPRKLASFLGFLGSLSQTLLPERLRTRALHVNKSRALAKGADWDPFNFHLMHVWNLTFGLSRWTITTASHGSSNPHFSQRRTLPIRALAQHARTLLCTTNGHQRKQGGTVRSWKWMQLQEQSRIL